MFGYSGAVFLIGIIALIYYPFSMNYINNKLSSEQKAFLISCQSALSFFITLFIVVITFFSWRAYYSPMPSNPMPLTIMVLLLLIIGRRIELYLKFKRHGFPKTYLSRYVINSFILLAGIACLGIYFAAIANMISHQIS